MILCQHGCGQAASHQTKSSLGSGPFKGAPVDQCAKSPNSCPAVKARKIANSIEKYGAAYPWQTKDIKQKRNQTNIDIYGHACSLKNVNQQAKRKKTMLERYGVEEPTMNEEIRVKAAAGIKQSYVNNPDLGQKQVANKREKYGSNMELVVDKIRLTQIANGRWIDPTLRSEWKQYKYEVQYYTYRNYRKLKHIINPDNLPLGRKTYQLDHIYSRKSGFENGVGPTIIAHPENLRVIPAINNRLKSYNCDITLEELLAKTKGT